jgi:hypothetical protein
MPRFPWRTALIVALVVAQSITFLTGSLGWPVYAYCMYAHARPGPPRTTHTELVATLADGRSVTIDPFDLGLGPWAFRRLLLVPVLEGAPGPTADLFRRIEAQFGSQVLSLRRELDRARYEHGALTRWHESHPIARLPQEAMHG